MTAPSTFSSISERSHPAWHHDTLQANGINFHYVTAGEGPLLLLLHGFPEFWYSWRHQIPTLAKTHKVVALDLRGYNDTDKPQGHRAYRLPILIQDVEAVIKALGYDQCTLVGHDWGGAIAWGVANQHPDLINNLIVLNLPHPVRFFQGMRTPQQLLKSWYVGLFQLPWVPEFLYQLGDYRAFDAIFNSTLRSRQALTQDDINAYKLALSKPGATTAAINYYRNVISSDWLNIKWQVLTMPVLMIWGEDDSFLGKELTYGTEEYAQDFQIHYVPNCGHWVQQERPELVNQYICDFLAE